VNQRGYCTSENPSVPQFAPPLATSRLAAMRLQGSRTGSEGVCPGPRSATTPPRPGRRRLDQLTSSLPRASGVGLWRRARRVELGRLRGQMHGNDDLLDDRVGLDDGDETQGVAALGALDVDGKGPSQPLCPRDIARLACWLPSVSSG